MRFMPWGRGVMVMVILPQLLWGWALEAAAGDADPRWVEEGEFQKVLRGGTQWL